MGVHGLWQLLQPTGRPVTLESLEGKILAIDVSIWLHKTTKGMRGNDGATLQNAHLLGLFNRMCKLLFYKIKPIFVFDGGVPALKRQTMAARKQRASLAEAKSKKSTEKILTNYIQSQAIRKVIGKETTESVAGIPQPSTSGQDLFELPPIPERSDSSDNDSDIDFSWEARMEQRQIIQSEFQDLHEIDINSEDFKSLPPEIRHEILTELKETRKRTHWCRAQDLPQESDDFSSYQMAKLMKQSRLSGQIETARREMNAQSIGGFADSLPGEGEIESQRIMSRDSSHVILVRGKNKRDGSQPWGSGMCVDSHPKIRSSETNSKKTNMLISFQMQPNFEADTSTVKKVIDTSKNVSITEKENQSSSKSSTSHFPLSKNSCSFSKSLSPQKSSVAEIVDLYSSESESDVEFVGKDSAIGVSSEIQVKSIKPCEKQVGELENVDISDESDPEVLEVKQNKAVFELRRLPDKVVVMKNGKVIQDLPTQGQYRFTQLPCECRQCKQTGTMEIDSDSDNSDIEVISANISPVKCMKNNVYVQNLKCSPRGRSKSVIEIDDLESDNSDIEIMTDSKNKSVCRQSSSDAAVSEDSDSKNSDDLGTTDGVATDKCTSGAKNDEMVSKISSEMHAHDVSDLKRIENNKSPSLVTDAGNCESVPRVPGTESLVQQSEKDRTTSVPDVLLPDPHLRTVPNDLEKTDDSESESENADFRVADPSIPEVLRVEDETRLENSTPAITDSGSSESESDGEDFIEVESDQDMVVPSIEEIDKAQSSNVEADVILSDSSHSSDVVTMGSGNVKSPSNNIAEKFQQLTQEELENMADDLEVEGEVLRSERAKQDRMARTITEQMYAEAQDLLTLFGAPYLVSPMEAEAQCAYLDQTDQCDGSITEDSDIWLFGGQRVYKNFFNQDKHLEFYRMDMIKSQLALDRQKLINIALLSGCDYTDGIQGVGPVTATEILAEFPGEGYEGLKKFKEWWDEAQKQINIPTETKIKSHLRQLEIKPGFPSPAVVDAFLNPAVDTSDEAFSWGRPDLDLLREFAIRKFGWTKTKIDDVLLPVFKKLNEGTTQMTITRFFMPTYLNTETRQVKSKRLKRALNRVMAPQQEEATDVEKGDSEKEKLVKAVSKAKEVLERGTRGGKRRKQIEEEGLGLDQGKGRGRKKGGRNTGRDLEECDRDIEDGNELRLKREMGVEGKGVGSRKSKCRKRGGKGREFEGPDGKVEDGGDLMGGKRIEEEGLVLEKAGGRKRGGRGQGVKGLDEKVEGAGELVAGWRRKDVEEEELGLGTSAGRKGRRVEGSDGEVKVDGELVAGKKVRRGEKRVKDDGTGGVDIDQEVNDVGDSSSVGRGKRKGKTVRDCHKLGGPGESDVPESVVKKGRGGNQMKTCVAQSVEGGSLVGDDECIEGGTGKVVVGSEESVVGVTRLRKRGILEGEGIGRGNVSELKVNSRGTKRSRRGRRTSGEMKEGQREGVQGETSSVEPLKVGRGRGRGRGKPGRGKVKVGLDEVPADIGKARGAKKGRGARGRGLIRHRPNASMIRDEVDLSDKSSDEFDSDDDMLLSQALDEAERSQLEELSCEAGFVK